MIFPAAVAGDLRDRNRVVPLRAFADRRHLAAAHKAELAALMDDAAQAFREAAGLGAVDHDMRDRELADEQFAAQLEIDRDGKTAQFGIGVHRTGVAATSAASDFRR